MRDDRRLQAEVRLLWTNWHRRFHRLLVSLLILAVSVDDRVHVPPISHNSDMPTVLQDPHAEIGTVSLPAALRPLRE